MVVVGSGYLVVVVCLDAFGALVVVLIGIVVVVVASSGYPVVE